MFVQSSIPVEGLGKWEGVESLAGPLYIPCMPQEQKCIWNELCGVQNDRVCGVSARVPTE